MSSLLWGLIGKRPQPPNPRPLLKPLEVPPVKAEPPAQPKPQPPEETIATATTVESLNLAFDSAVKRTGYSAELTLAYATRLQEISNQKENQ
jgi:hypothetical protein